MKKGGERRKMKEEGVRKRKEKGERREQTYKIWYEGTQFSGDIQDLV
jgi:hypothetical protein